MRDIKVFYKISSNWKSVFLSYLQKQTNSKTVNLIKNTDLEIEIIKFYFYSLGYFL